jgi:hypothetical protein
MSSASVSKVISALHAALDFSVDRVVEELQGVPESEFDATLTAVCRHVVQYETMCASISHMNRCEWATILEQEEAEADHRYVRMTQSEFEAEKQRAKRDRRFGSWDEWRRWVERIDALRRPARVVKRQPTPLEILHSERHEILRYPHAMFASEEAARAALREVNAEILRLGGRVDRREERTDEERESVTCIEARLRQARAVKACRQFIAAATIRKLFRKKECSYCFDTFKNSDHGDYCSRSCEKFALRGKYD